MSISATSAAEHVTIESIRIERAPGIDGAFGLPTLSSDITVIHGPNGSGKSTTARALHSLLWPDPPDDNCLVIATLRYAGHHWTLRRDGRAVRCERDGVVHTRLSFSHLGPGNRDRYHLALHDLLDTGDEHFAALVTREASGGYDLDGAAAAIGFDQAPSLRSASSLASDVGKRRSEHKELLQKQASLSETERSLASLEDESERAKRAGLEINRLSELRHALEARSALVEADYLLNRFNPDMTHVTAHLAELIAGWRSEEPLLRLKLHDLDQVIEREQLQLDETGLGAGPNTAREIHLLEGLRDELIRVEADQSDLVLKLEPERARLRRLHASIAPLLPESLQAEEAVTLLRTYVDALARQDEADQIASAEALLAAWLPRPDAAPDLDRLQKGLWDLTVWLQTPPPAENDIASPRPRMPAWSSDWSSPSSP